MELRFFVSNSCMRADCVVARTSPSLSWFGNSRNTTFRFNLPKPTTHMVIAHCCWTPCPWHGVWNECRLRTTPDGVTVHTISEREECPFTVHGTNSKVVGELTLSIPKVDALPSKK